MLIEEKVKVARSNPNYSMLSFFTSVYILFIVLSFRDYFFFVPDFSRPYPEIAFVQVFTALGWIFLIVLPPLALANWSSWSKGAPRLILLGALLWPLSTLTIKALNLVHYENAFVGYLGEHPLFLVMEFGVPALYLYIWKVKRSKR
jgi:hypothetical protein